jgi:hypothetical protein
MKRILSIVPLLPLLMTCACSGTKRLINEPFGSSPRDLTLSVEWERTFAGAGFSGAPSIRQTADGGYIVVDDFYSEEDNKNDIWLIKLDAAGDEQWNKMLGRAGWKWPAAVRQTAEGGFVITGGTITQESEEGDFLLIKTDARGNQEWNRTLGGSGMDWATDVKETADGGYVVVGLTTSYALGQSDALLIKTDADGIEEWHKTIGGPYSDFARAIRRTTDGGYIIAGNTASRGAGLDDAWLIKVDADGNKEWDSVFGGLQDDGASAVEQTAEGGYILAGGTGSFGKGEGDVWLIKVDAEGNEEWDSVFGGPKGDGATSVHQVADGGYILVGSTQVKGYDPEWGGDIWLIKTDAAGSLEWDTTFGNEDDYEFGFDIESTSDVGFIIAGEKYEIATHQNSVWIIKLTVPAPAPEPRLEPD